ncbi:MAG: thioredoxin family protein [Firmicutes bacterium]|nr:thioredoxin family protein [Bacillota bacterium]
MNKNKVMNFSATWCGPCKLFAPIWNDVAAQLGDKFEFEKIDIDECEPLCEQHGIASVPTTILFHGGTEVKRRSGSFPNANAFIEWLTQN